MKNIKQNMILLVEDEAIIGMALANTLKDYDYRVTHVLNGRKAIETIGNKTNEINLILMDIDLGDDLDGTETAKIILKEHDIPIVFLSSHIERDIVAKTENISAYGYVVKNSGITVIDACIKMAFKLHAACFELKNQSRKIGKSENELIFLEKRYRRLFETAKDGILILNYDDGMIVDVNPFLVELLGYSKDQLLTKKIWEIGAFKNIDYSKQLYRELQDKDYIRYIDLPLETFDGELIHVEFVSNVYVVDNEKVIQCNIRDITERNRYEKTLTNHIDEKDALLKEIQHRTKNSFNMITSLINIRAGITQSGETKNVLEELTLRVRSISDLYSLLYETDSYYEVQLKTYFEKVIESMLNLAKNVDISKKIDEITVSTKDAATFGMILVELISNSIKYAFPGSKKGIINVDLKGKDSKMKLVVEDNGIGLPKDFDIVNTKTVGLKLVNLMTNQLNCKLEVISENGTKIIITCGV